MGALAAALFTATLALVGKIGFDLWGRFRDRRGVASALAGEIGAYVDLLSPSFTATNLRNLAGFEHERRKLRLRAFGPLPTSHPVFDKVADKIGSLPLEAARGVSRIYNVVTGLRLSIANMASDRFVDAEEDVQRGLLNYVADSLEREGAAARELADLLHRVARQSFWCYLGDCWSMPNRF